MRAFTLFTLALLSGGCANTWDTLTSRKFRDKPFDTMFVSEDPLTVMKTSTEGDERAHAMLRLKEPSLNAGSPADQEEAIRLLTAAATADPSPVVRVAAIDALGRFTDSRAPGILAVAYHNGDGVPPGVEKPKPRKKPVNPDDPLLLAERYGLRGPVGYSEEVVSTIRSRAITALAATGRPEAMPTLVEAAQGGSDVDRDTQLAAIRGLSRMRKPETIEVLVNVMKADTGKDPAITQRARESLMNLTGLDYPPDPKMWETALKAGTARIAPEPGLIQQVSGWFTHD